jgi:hypothetical protein
LPSALTATLRDAPICAIHSRSAEIAISRPTMTKATIALTRSSCNRISSAAQTRNLSATGSRKAPKEDVWFSLRANQPSSQSVSATTMNSTVASRLRVGPSSGRWNTPTISGIAMMRAQVSSVGIVKNIGPLCPEIPGGRGPE